MEFLTRREVFLEGISRDVYPAAGDDRAARPAEAILVQFKAFLDERRELPRERGKPLAGVILVVDILKYARRRRHHRRQGDPEYGDSRRADGTIGGHMA